MADSEVLWKSALTPQKAPTYGNQTMFITSPKELQLVNADYVVVFEGTKKYHVAMAEAINPFTLLVIIPEHDTAEQVSVKVFVCQNSNLAIHSSLKFTYISQMEHTIAKFLAQCASDPEVAEKLDAIWTVLCMGKDDQELWDKMLAQAFVQLELPIEWTLVGDVLQKDNEAQETLLHFAANHGLKELINVFLDLPGARLALSTYNKSGLMPRDVAQENGRLDLVELLDTDRFVENRKGRFSKDCRRFLRNSDHCVTTITNSRNHSVNDDIQLLLELHKLVKARKNGSPVNRHSWPVKAASFSLEKYIEDVENELAKTSATANLDNSKPLFLDENLHHLRSLTEELCQLRSQNSQKMSKEISVIADKNRTPMHSRRMSCPASVSRRRKNGSQEIPKTSPTLRDSRTRENHVDTDDDPENKPESTAAEPIFSTPPHSPTVEQVIDVPLPAAITPPLDESLDHHEEIVEPCEFTTPPSNTPTSSPGPPTSPIPVVLSTAQRRSQSSWKERPNTWYGEFVDIPNQEEGGSRRSNSLEDFSKKFAQNDDTDDESLSEVNSKENLLQTLSSMTEKGDRSASFVSSLSDLSVGKESLCSETEVGHEEGSDEGKYSDEHESTKDAEHEEEDERQGITEPEEKEDGGENEDRKDDEDEHEHVIGEIKDSQEHEKFERIQEFEEPSCTPSESKTFPEQDEVRRCETDDERCEPGELIEIENLKDGVAYGDHDGHEGIIEDPCGLNEELGEIDQKTGDGLEGEDQDKHSYFDHMESVDDETEILQPDIIYLPEETGSEISSLSHDDVAVDVENHVDEKTTTEEVEDSKHIRFDETIQRSQSPCYVDEEEDVPMNNEVHDDDDEPVEFRHRAELLYVTKMPVKRTGSDISVTSLQDVQLDVHMTSRDDDVTPGVLNAARKARSHGDLSVFHDTRNEITKDDESDEEDRENEIRRIAEDQLSVQQRIKKLENDSKVSSDSEKLDQITNSRVNVDREDEDQQKSRRWSNFFNPKLSKKPSRTPTFRRDALRSSMSSLKPGGKSGGKKSIDALVVGGHHTTMLAKHSATAPALHVSVGKPRSMSKNDSPGTQRKSPTVGSLESEDMKAGAESSEETLGEDVNEALRLEVDSDLENFDQEPEAWSVTVDRKVLKKMSTKEIKRQDVILELIKTERHHVRTLKIIQQVFYRGLNKQANYSTDKLDNLFPRINELLEISSIFLRNLKCRQDEAASVHKIGDIILKHFSGESAQRIKEAYGEFVSKYPEAVALYKHYFKTDKKFSNFIKKCHGHRVVRRLSIPECFTLVTQRMTKYPPLIEAIMKATKTSNADYKELQKSLLLVKDALQSVDNAIKDYEKQMKLKDIKMRVEKGSVVLKGGKKLKNSRFVDYHSKMVFDGVLMWKSARGKLTETYVVVLESMVAFLQENDKKFSLLSVDGKVPCITLKTLMVREVATDKNAIYFVSTSKKEPEMYEFVCSNPKEKKQWITIISEAIANAPDDTGDLFQSPEEERRLTEERVNRRDEILEMMKGKDQELSVLIEEKNKLCSEMKDILHTLDGNGKSNDDETVSSTEKARSILLTAIHRTTHLTTVSIQHLHESHSDSELAAAVHDEKTSAPKRAETFGGFDRRASQKESRQPHAAAIAEGTSEVTSEVNHVAQRRDSGCSTTSLASESMASALNVLNQGQDVEPATFLQILDALQWVLLKFTQQETAYQQLRTQFRNAETKIENLRSLKYQNDKSNLLLKEHHQAELTRQKEAYNDLERTFDEQVKEQNVKLKNQQEQHQNLLSNFSELRKALANSYPSVKS